MMVNSMLANHEQPAVLSAVMKSQTTHRARLVMNDAMVRTYVPTFVMCMFEIDYIHTHTHIPYDNNTLSFFHSPFTKTVSPILRPLPLPLTRFPSSLFIFSIYFPHLSPLLILALFSIYLLYLHSPSSSPLFIFSILFRM